MSNYSCRSRRRPFPVIAQEGGAKRPPFPIITPQIGGAGKRKRKVVVFITKTGQRVSFVASTTRKRQRLKSSQRTQQKGRGLVGDYLKNELGDVATTVVAMFVSAGVAEGRDLASKGFRYLKNKLTRHRRATQAPTQVPTQPTFAYDV